MRVRALLVVLAALTLIVAACGDDDDQGAVADRGSTSTTTTSSTTEPAQDEVRMRVEVPEDLSDDFTMKPSDDHAWLAELYGTDSESAIGRLGVGSSPEPATLSDPDTPITGNQALAAARGVADDLFGYSGDGEVVVNEETTLSSGRPAWHVRLIIEASGAPTEIDLVGLEDAGSFQYAVAATYGLPEDTVTKLHDAVAAASMA